METRRENGMLYKTGEKTRYRIKPIHGRCSECGSPLLYESWYSGGSMLEDYYCPHCDRKKTCRYYRINGYGGGFWNCCDGETIIFLFILSLPILIPLLLYFCCVENEKKEHKTIPASYVEQKMEGDCLKTTPEKQKKHDIIHKGDCKSLH